MISLLPLDPTNEDSIQDVIFQADLCNHFHDSREPREEDYVNAEEYMARSNTNLGPN